MAKHVVGPARTVRLMAIDDGHSEVKVASLSGGTSGEMELSSFASRTVRGFEDVDPNGKAPPNLYVIFPGQEADQERFDTIMVAGRGRGAGSDLSENRTQDYPTSDRNRVLVHHALHRLDAAHGDFRIGTTLPYSDFHVPGSGRRNTALIEAKKANIARPVFGFDRDAMRPQAPGYALSEHSVYSEGTAAFFDAMLDYRDGAVSVNEAFAQRFQHSSSFVVVDIGGKTTDVVFGSWSGSVADAPLIKIGMSESLNMGLLQAADELEDDIKLRFKIRHVADRESALFERTVPVYGTPRDVSTLCDVVVEKLFQRIKDPILRHAGDGSHLAFAIFVGGGAELLRSQIASMFDPELVRVPEAPRFANARGILKMMKAEHDARVGMGGHDGEPGLSAPPL